MTRGVWCRTNRVWNFIRHIFRWRQRHKSEQLQFCALALEMGIVCVDTNYTGDDKEHDISGSGKQQKRSTPLEFVSVRSGFNQVIKHRVPPLVAGAFGSRELTGLLRHQSRWSVPGMLFVLCAWHFV